MDQDNSFISSAPALWQKIIDSAGLQLATKIDDPRGYDDDIYEEIRRQSWLGKSGQRDKWSFCLIAAMMTANRRDNEQTTAPEPHTGIQVEGGSGRHQG
jgi:hypothetical protein